jgi:hypothetical protein
MMPWYAKLERLPKGYDNSREAIFFIDKEYHVKKHENGTVIVFTPNSIVAPHFTMDVGMARRLFSKPYWRNEYVAV